MKILSNAPFSNGAIYYDYLMVKGGAEAVTTSLFEHFCDAKLVVGGISKELFDSDVQSRISCLLPLVQQNMWNNIKVMSAFNQYQKTAKSNFDWHLYSGIYAPLAASKAGKNIYYCHTPPRFLYDLRDFYSKQYGGVGALLIKALEMWYQPKFLRSLAMMDKIFVNSRNVQRRLLKYTGVQSEVLYPPCQVERFSPGPAECGSYYLSTARLESLKRVDLIVEAFKRVPQKKLVIMSGGSELVRLKQLAEGFSNISFTGWVTIEQRERLIRNAIATVYIPRDEDFGMAPVESMAMGKPVVGVAEGGLLETVEHMKAGYLISYSDTESLINGLVDATLWMDSFRAQGLKENCLKRAELFSDDLFYQKIEEAIHTL